MKTFFYDSQSGLSTLDGILYNLDKNTLIAIQVDKTNNLVKLHHKDLAGTLNSDVISLSVVAGKESIVAEEIIYSINGLQKNAGKVKILSKNINMIHVLGVEFSYAYDTANDDLDSGTTNVDTFTFAYKNFVVSSGPYNVTVTCVNDADANVFVTSTEELTATSGGLLETTPVSWYNLSGTLTRFPTGAATVTANISPVAEPNNIVTVVYAATITNV